MMRRQYLRGLIAFGAAMSYLAEAMGQEGSEERRRRGYLIFFDWDSASLTDSAKQVVDEAAEVWIPQTVVVVHGHTDTEYSPEYGTTVSLKRAQAVAAELIHAGIPRSAISIEADGPRNQFVPTPDEVREPQNRRVNIIFINKN